jgi:outer membrane protein OmpA-like peptidoglycan-associated protein
MSQLNELEAGDEGAAPVWAVFGDLMAGMVGALVLILAFALGLQLDLAERLQAEVKQRQAEQQRRQRLEQALAGPLAAGRVTLVDGRIGISGAVLFAFSSAELQPEGRQLLKSLAAPLAAYLQASEQVLMVSGFTDDRSMRGGSNAFADNWELSAQRALTVTRTLIEEGLPAAAVFAAAFGSQQPVASNADPQGRAQNRRVEMAPMPRRAGVAAAPASAASAPASSPAASPVASPASAPAGAAPASRG